MSDNILDGGMPIILTRSPMRLAILLLLGFCSSGSFALAQQVKVGVSAGVVRSFVYPQSCSTTNRYDYIHAQGEWGYLAMLQAQRPIGRKTAFDVGVRFVRTPTTYDLFLVVPEAFQVTHHWSATRRNYQLYTGVSHILAGHAQQLRIFGGGFAGVETQRLQLRSTSVSTYRSSGYDITVEELQYATHPKPVWVAGAEAGFGLRLFERADLNLRYSYYFTPTAGTDYSSLLTYTGAPGSPRSSTGTIKGRATSAAAEVVVWIN